MKTDKLYRQGFFSLILGLGLIWSMAGIPKVIEGKFPFILKGILEQFATKNPYPFYKSFLENTAIPNAETFGYLVMFGEPLTGVTIVLSTLYLLIRPRGNRLVEIFLIMGLIGGLVLNTNFYLGGGWTNVNKSGMNMLMIILEAVGLFFILRGYRQKQ